MITSPKVLLLCESRDGMLVRKAILDELGWQVCGHVGSAIPDWKAEFDAVIFVVDRMESALALIGDARQKWGSVPVVLISGFAEIHGLTSDSTGADYVLQKRPAEGMLMVRAIKRLLKNRPKKKWVKKLRVA